MADFTLDDPLGRQITLHDHTSYGHIVKGHPEVIRHRVRVQQAIASPEIIQYKRQERKHRMVTTDTLEGIINATLSYHYDATNDVLYLRLLSHRDAPAL